MTPKYLSDQLDFIMPYEYLRLTKPLYLELPSPKLLNLRTKSYQPLIKPGHSLKKCLLLRELLDRHTHITSHREAMLDATEKVDLVRDSSFL